MQHQLSTRIFSDGSVTARSPRVTMRAMHARAFVVGRVDLRRSNPRVVQLLPTPDKLCDQQLGHDQGYQVHPTPTQAAPSTGHSSSSSRDDSRIGRPMHLPAAVPSHDVDLQFYGAGRSSDETAVHLAAQVTAPAGQHPNTDDHQRRQQPQHQQHRQHQHGPSRLLLHRLVVPPSVRSQGHCCAHTCIMVSTTHTRACGAASTTSSQLHGGSGAHQQQGMQSTAHAHAAGPAPDTRVATHSLASSSGRASPSRPSTLQSRSAPVQGEPATPGSGEVQLRLGGPVAILRVETCGRELMKDSNRCMLHEGAANFEVWARRPRGRQTGVGARQGLRLGPKVGAEQSQVAGLRHVGSGPGPGAGGLKTGLGGPAEQLLRGQGSRSPQVQGAALRGQGPVGVSPSHQQAAPAQLSQPLGPQGSASSKALAAAGHVEQPALRSRGKGVGAEQLRGMGPVGAEGRSDGGGGGLPQLLYSCHSEERLAEFLGVEAVRFQSHWGRQYGQGLESLLVRPGVVVDQEEEGRLVGQDGRAVAMTTWGRSKLYRRVKASNAKGRGLQLHLRPQPSTLQPLLPRVADMWGPRGT